MVVRQATIIPTSCNDIFLKALIEGDILDADLMSVAIFISDDLVNGLSKAFPNCLIPDLIFRLFEIGWSSPLYPW